MTKKYQMILFDLDDTLIDFTYSEEMGLKHIHRKYFSAINYTEFALVYRSINSKYWSKVSCTISPIMPRDIPHLRFCELKEKFNLSSAHDVGLVIKDYHEEVLNHYYLEEKIIKTLDNLKEQGFEMGIITNGISHEQSKKFSNNNLSQWFSFMIVSDEEKVAKPNVLIFEKALSKISKSIPAKEILMVGDNLVSDGLGAKNFQVDYAYVDRLKNQGEVNRQEADISFGGETINIPIKFHLSCLSELPHQLS